jgi:hypothetical protein
MSIAAHSKNGAIYIEDITALNLPTVQKVSRHDVDEHEVDAACKDNLVAVGFDKTNVSLGNSGIAAIDKNIPSKGLGGGKGKLDACLVENDKRILIPSQAVLPKWFVAVHQGTIHEHVTAKKSQGMLYENQMANIPVEVPVNPDTGKIDVAAQECIIAEYERLNAIKSQLEKLVEGVDAAMLRLRQLAISLIKLQ